MNKIKSVPFESDLFDRSVINLWPEMGRSKSSLDGPAQ